MAKKILKSSMENATEFIENYENGIVKGTYTYSDVEKDTELANTNYYKLVMTSNSITQNGKEVTGTKENTYEMGIDTSGKKKSLVMINEKSYTMYYCIES